MDNIDTEEVKVKNAQRQVLIPHKKLLLSWMCVVKYAPHVRKCINKDVARKIAEMVPIDFTNIQPLRLVTRQSILSGVDYDNLYIWRSENWFRSQQQFAICHECCLPCTTFFFDFADAEGRSLCAKHLETFQNLFKCPCFGKGFFMSEECAKKFQTTHIFPEKANYPS